MSCSVQLECSITPKYVSTCESRAKFVWFIAGNVKVLSVVCYQPFFWSVVTSLGSILQLLRQQCWLQASPIYLSLPTAALSQEYHASKLQKKQLIVFQMMLSVTADRKRWMCHEGNSHRVSSVPLLFTQFNLRVCAEHSVYVQFSVTKYEFVFCGGKSRCWLSYSELWANLQAIVIMGQDLCHDNSVLQRSLKDYKAKSLMSYRLF